MTSKHFVFIFISISYCLGTILEQTDDTKYLKTQTLTLRQDKTKCEFYNATCFDNGGDPKTCQGEVTCKQEERFCFAVWRTEESNLTRHKSGRNVKLMGCLPEPSSDCSEENECLEDGPELKSHFFCCCRGPLCNAKFEWVPKAQTPLVPTTKPPTINSKTDEHVMIVLFILLAAVVIFIGLVCYVVKKRKEAQFEALSTSERDNHVELGNGQFQTLQLPPNIELLNEIGKGKSGTVRKGKLNDNVIAIKIFLPQCKQSWTLEKDIYSLPQMVNHDSILKFLGVTERRDNLGSEYWLGTEYHNKGSLYDFLKANLVSWDDLCKIAMSIGKGLAFLHEETPGKPAIAHRDFKSKNVLIKDDLTACISDFGLALILEPGFSNNNSQVAQVGTTRYMAPEVLECHISFEKNCFARVDMYACGLVLWELASRCTLNHVQHDANIINSEPVVEEYKLPYEAEISKNPTIDEMLNLVAVQRVRPQCKTGNREWKSQPGSRTAGGSNNMDMLCDTIKELWEHDEGARISAACLVERVRTFQHQSFVIDMNERLNALNMDSGVGSTASSNNGTSSTDLEGQGLDSRAQSTEMTEMEPLVNLNQNP